MKTHIDKFELTLAEMEELRTWAKQGLRGNVKGKQLYLAKIAGRLDDYLEGEGE